MSERPRTQVPIAVVGVSALFPGSSDGRGFWSDILAGRDLVTDVPPSHWLVEDYYDPDPSAPDKTYSKRGAFLSAIDFDPMEFGVPPSIVPATDSAQILALIVAQKVLDDAAQGQFASMNRDRISVLLGVTSAQELLGSMVSRLQRPVWLKALRESGIPEAEAQAACDRIAKSYVPWQESSFPGLLGNVVAGRIANRFDLRGTNTVTDAACASSLAALSMGINELALGQSDLVITGGVDAMNDIFMYMCFSKTPALSPTGDCRPFSDAADGTLLGEGMAMIALKRLDDAERDGDRVYAVIRGLGSASDGRSKSVYAPLPEGQARALRRTYEVAGYGPDTVELVEAHGTGTKAGDAAEFEGLRIAFEESGRKDRQWCALGSVKSQIGHTKAAAGAAGLFKAIMALHHKVIPPTIKIDRPNPKLSIDESPFYLSTQKRPWIRDASHPRRASVSSFGFGGSNFHVALEEYVPAGKAKRAWRYHTATSDLVLLSAPTAAELVAKCRALAGAKPALPALARSSQHDFSTAHAARLALIASNDAELVDKLEKTAAMIEKAPSAPFSTPNGVHYAAGAAEPGDVAFLFPGQGSQYVGMGADVAMAFDAARSAWDDAAAKSWDGARLHDVVFPLPAFTDDARAAAAKRLVATEWAQPALGASSLALVRVLAELGVRPSVVAGHSFGEVTALAAAGALSADALFDVARRRGELMRDAAASVPGAMTAVAMPIADVLALVSASGANVVVANHNAPEQVVLSGSVDEIAKVEAAYAAKGGTPKRLPVATAFHSPLVASSSAPFLSFLAGVPVAAPTLDVIANADATAYPRDPEAVRQRLAAQLASPVRFVDQIEAMYGRGVRTFVEVGAGSVLSELTSRILGDRPHRSVSLDRKGKDGVASLLEGLGRLAIHGVAIDFAPLWQEEAPPSDKPVKKPAMVMPINGTNSGKPYPPRGGAKDLPPPNPPRKELPPAAVASPAVASAPLASPVVAPAAPVAPAVTTMSSSSSPPRPVTTPTPSTALAAPSAHRPATIVTGTAPDVHLAWVAAYQEAQRQTADAHAAYQRAMADSHMAFLRTAETSFAGLSAMLTGQPMMVAPTHVVPALTAAPAAVTAPVSVPVAAPVPAPATVTAPVPTTVAAAVSAPAPAPAPAAVAAAVSAPAPAAPSVDLEALMLAIVAEKTGYPADMLGAEMELEADLGIDSIKRVEILAAMRERAPGLREVKATELASLRTLGQIVDHMRAHVGASAGPAAGAPTAQAQPASATTPDVDLEALMLAIVAEKTGYPADMLAGHMELEADLGIDSIKRVEILAAMRERAPGLREVKAAELATLRTLGQIVDHMRAHGGGGATAPAPAPAAAAPAAPAAAPAKLATTPKAIGRWAVREVASAPVGMALSGLLGAQNVLVTEDGGGAAAALVAELAAHGVRASVASSVTADATAVIFLGGLRAVGSIDEAIAVEREAFHVARTLAPRFAQSGGLFVTVQDTGGDFGLSGADGTRAYLGGIAALLRTAAREWPTASLKAIDCERGGRDAAAVAKAIAAELVLGGTTLEVGLHADGKRTTLASVPGEAVTSASTSAKPRLDASSVVVASGGARGVTAAGLVALAQAAKPRIVLLGRTALADEPAELRAVADEAGLKKAIVARASAAGQKPVPSEISAEVARILAGREVKKTLAALEAAGSKARYVAADVQDAPALAAALDSVRKEWGPITALVHGAGVLADKRLEEKTDEQFDRVFDTKIVGLRALLAATEKDPLTSICLFSSIAARTGNPGQCDYAMANEILNLVACAEQKRRGDACTVRSVGWGPWEGGMVTPGLKSHFEQMGVPLIPLDVGAKRTAEELLSARGDVTVIVGGESGDGALGAATAPSATVETRVSARTHAYLGDHRIGGMAVVPVTLALEWMLRAARACRPDLHASAVRDVKVLRGIRLDHFEDAGDLFVVRAGQVSNGAGAQLAVEIRGPSGAVHYAGTVDMTTQPLPPRTFETPAKLERWSGPVYDGHVLFHGERFQVVRSIEGVSRDGIAGTLSGAREAAWPSEAWQTDPAALDGGLQLVLLWARHVLGGASLPMGVAELRSYRGGLVDGPVRCTVRGRQVHDARAVSDVAFVDASGALIAELVGVETVQRPGEPAGKTASSVASA